MMFFAFLAVGAVLASLAAHLGIGALRPWTVRLRVSLAAALLFFGTDHLVTPERYIPMIEAFLPIPREIVLFTGICEIAGAIGLLIPRLVRITGWALALYFLSVYPANIFNAINGVSAPGLPTAQWYYWVRLLFQPPLIVLVLYATETFRLRRTSEKRTLA